jgi:GT2 family glycosyltransferase
MINTPKVDIILVNYNNSKDTIECLDSLSHISYPDYEVIVVDNASKNTKELEIYCKQYGAVLLKATENDGFSAGNNIGIREAIHRDADFVLLLNNDTLVEAEFLTNLVASYQRNPRSGIVGGRIYFNDDRSKLWYAGGEISFEGGCVDHYGYMQSMRDEFGQEKTVTFVTGCLMLIPMDVIKKVGLLAEEYFLYSEDADYCCRVMNAGYSLLYTPRAVIFHKVGAASGKGSCITQYYSTRNDFYLFNKYAPENIRNKSLRLLMWRKIKDSIKGLVDLKWVFRGYRDFKSGIVGKVQL